MQTMIAPPSVDSISPEVAEFARRHELENVLGAVVEMTADVFTMATSLQVEVGADAEVAGLNWIVLRLAIPQSDIAQAVALRRQWSQRIFDVCPAEKVCEYQLQFDWIN